VRIVLGLVPSMAVLGLVGAFADIVGRLTGGRDVSWAAAAYSWPALVVLVAAALIAAAATLTARSWQLSRHVRNLANVQGRPASAASRLTRIEKQPIQRSQS
jgi:sugar phosphate permease